MRIKGRDNKKALTFKKDPIGYLKEETTRELTGRATTLSLYKGFGDVVNKIEELIVLTSSVPPAK